MPRVLATPAALEAIHEVRAGHGPLLFFQSGGCCDRSCPMCFTVGDLVIGEHDVRLGDVGGCPVYIEGRQFEAWRHTQLVVDVEPGEAEGFSLAAGPGTHFIVRSRVFNPEEEAALSDP